jgi:O-antigen ligase
MLPVFSIIYLFSVVVIGCENSSLNQNIHDMNALMAFLSLAFLGMAFFLREEKESYGVSALSISLIIFLLYSASSFYFSSNADLSIYPALKIVSAIYLSIALIYFLKDIEVLKKALIMVFAFGGILATTGIIEQFFPFFFPMNWTNIVYSLSIFTSPNFLSGYLLIHIPIGVYLYFRASSSFAKILIGLAWILILVSLGFSKSQGGQLTACLQIIATIIYLLITKKPEQARLVGLGTLVSILIYFSLLKLFLEPNLIASIGSVEGVKEVTESEVTKVWIDSSVGIRLMYWSGAWRIFTEHWLLGSGLWTFVELYPQTGLSSRLPAHAHSMYLQTAAETGLIGFGLLVTCLTIFCSTLVRIFKRGSAKIVEINFYITVSIIGLLINNIIEYNWLTANFIYYFVFLIISVEILNRETLGYKKWVLVYECKGFWAKAVPILMVLGAVVIVQYYSYQRLISHDIPMSATMEEMLANTTKAKQLCHRCGSPHYLSGIANLEMYRLSQNRENLILAEHDFNEVIHRNPYSLGTYLILGKTKSLQGNFSEAKEYYIKAMKDSRHVISAITEIRNIEKNIEGIKP